MLVGKLEQNVKVTCFCWHNVQIFWHMSVLIKIFVVCWLFKNQNIFQKQSFSSLLLFSTFQLKFLSYKHQKFIKIHLMRSLLCDFFSAMITSQMHRVAQNACRIVTNHWWNLTKNKFGKMSTVRWLDVQDQIQSIIVVGNLAA